MYVIFKYDPAMEQPPLKSGMGGQNNTSKTELALRSIRDDVDYMDKQAVEQWIKHVIQEDGLNLEQDAERISNAWREVEAEASLRLAKMFATDWDPGNVIAYLTLSHRCPYHFPAYFWVYRGNKYGVGTCLHELQHFYTHMLIEPLFQSAGQIERFNDFKESLTVLLNQDCADLMRMEDKGYPQHQHLRSQLLTKYKDGDSVVALANWYLAGGDSPVTAIKPA
jgi:hypothetical protein